MRVIIFFLKRQLINLNFFYDSLKNIYRIERIKTIRIETRNELKLETVRIETIKNY